MRGYLSLQVTVLAFISAIIFLIPSGVWAAFPKEDCWKDTSHYASASDYNSIYYCCSHESIAKRGLPIIHSARQDVCVTACNGLEDIYLTKKFASRFYQNCCTGGMGGIAAVNVATRKLNERCKLAKAGGTDPVTKKSPTETAAAAAELQPRGRPHVDIDNFCHTRKECSDASGDAKNFKPGFNCPNKGDQSQGYCLAPEPEYELQMPFFGVTKIGGLRNLIAIVFNTGIGILIILSALFFVWGAFKYLLSSTVRSIERTKQIMVDSLMGLALGLGAFALLSNINPNTLVFQELKIYSINRMAFFKVIYCKDLESKPKLADAGTPLDFIDYQVAFKKGFDIQPKDAKCGREYYIEGGDSTGVCTGAACETNKERCLPCTLNVKGQKCDKDEKAARYGCADISKFQFFGEIALGGEYKADEIFVTAYCITQENGQTVISNDDVSDDTNIGTVASLTGSTNSSGSIGSYFIDSIDPDDIKEFDEDCKDDKGVARYLLNGQFNTDSLIIRDTNYLITKEHCGRNIGPIALDDVLLYVQFGEAFGGETGSGEHQMFSTFNGTLEGYARNKKDKFDLFYLNGGWTTEEILTAAEHKNPLQCDFQIVGLYKSCPDWAKGAALCEIFTAGAAPRGL
jgi:hypothetical protein